ncbi:MAG: hypothetical protein ABL903_06310 [Methylococcales bacterium]
MASKLPPIYPDIRRLLVHTETMVWRFSGSPKTLPVNNHPPFEKKKGMGDFLKPQ